MENKTGKFGNCECGCDEPLESIDDYMIIGEKKYFIGCLNKGD